MVLNEDERQDLIMYLLSKVSLIEGYSKFYNLMYLLKEEVGEDVFSDYKFDSYFLTIRDNVLDDDLSTLVLQTYVYNDPLPIDLSHSHDIKISKEGVLHLKTLRVDTKLKNKLGNEKLKRLEGAIIQYNKLDTKTLMEMAKKYQS